MFKDDIAAFEMNYRVWATCTHADNQANPNDLQHPINRVRFLFEVGQFWLGQARYRLRSRFARQQAARA